MTNARLPLFALLSGPLVAFTIEADNTLEQQVTHTTTAGGVSGEPRRGPWLVSLAMWANSLRWLLEGEATVAELRARARTATNLDGLRRWGYVTIDGRGRGGRAGDGPRPTDSSVLALTSPGRRVAQQWATVPPQIEARWRERFGAGAVDRLRAALAAVCAQLERDLPDCLPILRPGLFCRLEDRAPAPRDSVSSEQPLWSLLSRALLSFALAYEQDAPVSLAVAANVLRVLAREEVPAAALPAASGVSKEAIAMALGLLQRRGLVAVDSVRRRRIVRLSDQGMAGRRRAADRASAIEQRWSDRFGGDAVTELRAAAAPVAGDLTATGSPLFAGLGAPAGTWRARLPPPETLPWFPMVLHRGGFPDGA